MRPRQACLGILQADLDALRHADLASMRPRQACLGIRGEQVERFFEGELLQ